MADEKKPEGADKINTLREDLYSRDDLSHTHDAGRGQKFTHKEYDIKNDWTTENIATPETIATSTMSRTKLKFFSPIKAILIFAVFFFIFSVGVAGYVFLSGSNTVSTDNVDISAVVPVSVSGGEEVPIKVTIENSNNIDLESADLRIDFPDGTKKATDLTSDFKRYEESLGIVPKNGNISSEVKAVFFGAENSTQELVVSIEYRVKDSNARLYKEKKYEFFLKSSPISVSVQALKEIQSGQDIDFVLNLNSNSNTPLENTLVKVEYPFGFEFKSGSPKPTYGKNAWLISSMQPADKKTIRIRGKIDGQNEEDRVFRFYVGIQDKNNEKEIGTNFLSVEHSVRVKRPFVGLDVAFNGDAIPEYVVRPSGTVRADVLWANNLPTRVTDTMLEVQLEGNLFDPLSVTSDLGFYRSSDNKIIWDQTSDPKLSILEPGAKGNEIFGFTVAPASYIIDRGIKNPEMKFSVTVKGKRVSETSVPEEINALITRKVKLATEVSFAAKSTYALGPLPNRGPLPPTVNQETTYTIIWSLTNTSNKIVNGQVKAFLPSYVKWLGAVSPSSETINFQPVGGLITWDVGDIDPYTGFSSEPREVAFQVAITPSLSQLGQQPVLVRDPIFTGSDDFTGTAFRIPRQSLTTDVRTDPGYVTDQGTVKQ